MSQDLFYIRVISPEGNPLGDKTVKIDGVPIGKTNSKGIVAYPADGKNHVVEIDGQQFQLPDRMAVTNNLLEIRLSPPQSRLSPPQSSFIDRIVNIPTPILTAVGAILVIMAIGMIAFALGYLPIPTPTTPTPPSITTPTPIPIPPEQPPSPYSPPQLTPTPTHLIFFFLLVTLLLSSFIESKERLQVGDFVVASLTLLFTTMLSTWEPLQAFLFTLMAPNIPKHEWGIIMAMITISVDLAMVLVAAFLGGTDLTAPATFFGGMGIWGVITGKLGILNQLHFLQGVELMSISQWWWQIKTNNFNNTQFTTTILGLIGVGLALLVINLWIEKGWLAITPTIPLIAFYLALSFNKGTIIALITAIATAIAVAAIIQQFSFGVKHGEGTRGGVGRFIITPSWDIVGTSTLALAFILLFILV